MIGASAMGAQRLRLWVNAGPRSRLAKLTTMSIIRPSAALRLHVVRTENLSSGVVAMKSAQDGA